MPIKLRNYNLVNTQKLEDEVLSKFHAMYPPNADECGKYEFPSIARANAINEIERWFKLIRDNTYTQEKKK